MRKTISIIAACIGAPLLAAGITLPSASADPTNTPAPNPTVPSQPGPSDEGGQYHWDHGIDMNVGAQ